MSDSELQKLRYDNKELREAADRLCSRIEALEADVVKWEEYANDMLDGKNERIEALEKECFALAANQCNFGFGDDYGHHRCKRIETLKAALREIVAGYDWCMENQSNHIMPSVISEAIQDGRAALAPETDK